MNLGDFKAQNFKLAQNVQMDAELFSFGYAVFWGADLSAQNWSD